MATQRRLLSLLLLLPHLVVQSSLIAESTSLSPLARRILASERSLDQQYSDEDSEINRKCSAYLVSFLEGTTDAKDTCEGINNAYTAADCETLTQQSNAYEDEDDYFGQFYDRMCCQSLLNRYGEYCEDGNMLSNMHLLIVSSVLLLCEVAKAIVKAYQVHFLPEAGVCILVGTVCGIIGHLIPGIHIDDLSFDGQLFLSILLPPIIFEAALSVSKRDFRRRRLAIIMFAVFGTILSTFTTGVMVHYASLWLKNSTTIPMLDCIIYGALISSIDPVAILSVLTSLNMSQTDTIFILVFGESLLNDGVAITITQSLSSRFGMGSMSVDEIFGDIADFVIVVVGSIFVGFLGSILCMLYYWIFGILLNPAMEVASFFLWALIPYWICDGLEWSGIVAIVTMGFFMDVYVAAPQGEATTPMSPMTNEGTPHGCMPTASYRPSMRPADCVVTGDYKNMVDEDNGSAPGVSAAGTGDDDADGVKSVVSYYSGGKRLDGSGSIFKLNILRLLIHKDRIRLSEEADKHVRFVAHLMAQLAENAIFAYLGLFLLSRNYDWDAPLVAISVVICVLSRALMVVVICWVIISINKIRPAVRGCGYENHTSISRTAKHLQNGRTQLVLIFAGLRGAVSLALVENIPLYNNVTKEGCEFKPVLKAMTSASIIFTMFVFGGGAYYIFPLLGLKPDDGMKEAVDDDGVTSTVPTVMEPYEISFQHIGTAKRSGRPNPDSGMYEMKSIALGSGEMT